MPYIQGRVFADSPDEAAGKVMAIYGDCCEPRILEACRELGWYEYMVKAWEVEG